MAAWRRMLAVVKEVKMFQLRLINFLLVSLSRPEIKRSICLFKYLQTKIIPHAPKHLPEVLAWLYTERIEY
jgi:hypothetical protein